MSSFQQTFTARKPQIIALLVGLVLGPFISGMAGWQVTSATLRSTVENAIVQQQVKFCEVRARAVVADTTKLDYSARYKLAEEWAKMPWQAEARSAVISGCSDGLSQAS